MVTVATWCGRNLTVDMAKIQTFSSLSIEVKAKLKETETDRETIKYLERADAAKLTVEVPLAAALGVDVVAVLQDYLWCARRGQHGHFIAGGVDLLGVELMLESVATQDERFDGKGKMCACTMKLEFVQGGEKPVAYPTGGGTKKKSKKLLPDNGGYGTNTIAMMNRLEASAKSAAGSSTKGAITAGKD